MPSAATDADSRWEIEMATPRTTVLNSPLRSPDGRYPQDSWEVTWLPLSTSEHSWGHQTVILWRDEPPVKLVNNGCFYDVEPAIVSLSGCVQVCRSGSQVGTAAEVRRGGDYFVRSVNPRFVSCSATESAGTAEARAEQERQRHQRHQASDIATQAPERLLDVWNAMVADEPGCLDGVVYVERDWLVRDGLGTNIVRCDRAELDRRHVTFQVANGGGNALFEFRVWRGDEPLDNCPQRQYSRITSLDEPYLRTCLQALADMAGSP